MPNMTKPSTSLKVAIQAPGFGRNRTIPGISPTSTYGRAIPVAMAPNTA